MRLQPKKSADLIHRLGGYKKVAAELGITRQAVFLWRRDGIPALRIDQLKKFFDDSELQKIEMFKRTNE